MKTVIAITTAAVSLSCALCMCCTCRAQADDFARERKMMMDTQVMSRGIKDPKILDAVAGVDRHKFVPEGMREYAYEDISLPVGEGEAVPPAYFTALIAKMAEFGPGDKVLIIGIEAGYQAAVFSKLAGKIYCVEPSEKLAAEAGGRLDALGYGGISIKSGSAESGWLEHAPFSVIVITNQMDYAPKKAVDQLMMNGRIIMPMREYAGKKLIVMTKAPKGKDGYEMTAALVGPSAGEQPLGFPKKEQDKPDGKKWVKSKDGKWMKKNK
ncbi:MAG TPA: protein-L-isoaspartate O-methyltransferase [Candidatus Omnitrophota bacterium]|nr:protein-L-isoaspartate O-methyltransferase [Candidatus Omnitrophota bacterium]